MDYPQQAGNFVALRWDGKDDGGSTVPLNGGYGPTFRVSVPEAKGTLLAKAGEGGASKDPPVVYYMVSLEFCSGVQIGCGCKPPGGGSC
jgi:hypothetical protein